MKLRTKIAVLSMIIAIVSTFVASYLFHQAQEDVLEEKVFYHLSSTAQSRGKHVETFLRELRNKIEIAATHKELSNKELREIVEIDKVFYETFVLDKDGKIVASSDESKIGLDRSDDAYFVNARERTCIKDIYYSETIRIKGPTFTVSTPYAGGVLVARIGMDKLNEITTNRTGLGETGEVYLVNKEAYMITPSRFKEGVLLRQKVDTVNAKNCLDMLKRVEEEGHQGHSSVTLSESDYRGVSVLGAHYPIRETGWCLLAEIDEEEVFGIIENQTVKTSMTVSIIVVLFLILSGFIVGSCLEETYLGRKIKESKFAKLLSKIKIRYFFIFALVFSIAYFFTAVSFFQGWRNARFFDAVPDLIFFTIAFSVFGGAFKLKDLKARRLLAWGAGLLCLIKLSEIPLQELQAIRTISPFLWYPSMIISVLSFLLILASFEEVVE